MNPLRQVEAVFPSRLRQLDGYGMMLKLSCGHVQWVAGFDFKREVGSVPGGRLMRPCLEAPCYVPEKQMG